MAGTIITIAQQKGGSGKTTLTAHLSVALSRVKGMNVAILDTDPQGSLGEWFEAREAKLGEDGAGLEFRTASGWGARREARSLARSHDFVLIDTPPKADMDARPAIEAADLMLIPIQPSPVDLWATESTLDLASKEKTPGLLVLNRVPPRASLTGEMAEAMKGFDSKIAKCRLGNRVAFASAMGNGLTVMELSGATKAAEEVVALAAEMRKMAKALG